LPDTGSDFIIATTEKLICALIRADLSLRMASLDHLNEPTTFPSLLVATEMQGKLSFVVNHTESRKFLFGLFEEDRSRSIADVRLRFKIRPSLEPDTTPIVEPKLTFVPPVFLENLGDVDSLQLRLKDARLLQVKSISNDGPAFQIDDTVLGRNTHWPAELLVELLETLASWLRTKQGGEPQPLRLQKGLHLDALLRTIIDCYSRIVDIMDGEPTDRTIIDLEKKLLRIHPAFGAGYRFVSLLARALVQLDRNGELVSDLNDPDWQQFDIAVELIPGPGGHEIRIQLRPPDFLVEGEYHRRFLEMIRTPEGTELLYNKLKILNATKQDFDDFLHDPVQNQTAIFVRMQRDDLDLVLLQANLRGQRARFLYQMRFNVTSYPDVRVEGIEDVELLAAEVGSLGLTGRIAPDSPPYAYVVRFFRTLHTWQARMATSLAA